MILQGTAGLAARRQMPTAYTSVSKSIPAGQYP